MRNFMTAFVFVSTLAQACPNIDLPNLNCPSQYAAGGSYSMSFRYKKIRGVHHYYSTHYWSGSPVDKEFIADGVPHLRHLLGTLWVRDTAVCNDDVLSVKEEFLKQDTVQDVIEYKFQQQGTSLKILSTETTAEPAEENTLICF